MLTMKKEYNQQIQYKTHAHATGEEVIHKKEEIKCINIIKQYQKWLTMVMLWKKT